MPPPTNKKRVTIAPGSKDDRGGIKRKLKKPEIVDPIQRQGKDIRTRDLKKTRNAYADQAAIERKERQRDIKELRAKIEFLKRDSEKILRNQQLKFGTTLDDMKTVKSDLEQAKSTNDALLREVESKRQECDRLQDGMDDIIHKINNVMLEASDLNKEKKTFEANTDKIAKVEARCQQLMKNNRDLRSVLLKNHLDPSADARTMQINANSPTIDINDKRRESSLPVIYNRKNLVSEFRSEENLYRKEKRRVKPVFRRAKQSISSDSIYQLTNYRNLSNALSRVKPFEVNV